MATNPTYRVPSLTCAVDTRVDEAVVLCSGRIVSDTTEILRSTVKPLLAGGPKSLVIDLSNVNYVDSSGLGTIIALYASAKIANCQLTVKNLNPRLKELFSLTRLGEVLTKDNDPGCRGIDYSGM